MWAPKSPKFPNKGLGLNTRVEKTKLGLLELSSFRDPFPRHISILLWTPSRSKASLQRLWFLFQDSCFKSDGFYKALSFPLLFITSYSFLFYITCKRNMFLLVFVESIAIQIQPNATEFQYPMPVSRKISVISILILCLLKTEKPWSNIPEGQAVLTVQLQAALILPRPCSVSCQCGADR